jgi:hypothetical protein
VAHLHKATYGGGVFATRLVAGAPALFLVLASCSAPSVSQDAAVACGWNETDEPVVSVLEADAEQRARNVQRASIRWAAAVRVADIDDRFTPLVDALQETSSFAEEIQDMTSEQIAQIPTSRWDFAKYTQAVARDQCEQLQALVLKDSS